MKRVPFTRRVRNQRGAVLVEMALVTPLLAFMMMATAEVARVFIEHNTLTKAVRAAARHVASNAYQGTTGIVNIGAALRLEAQNLAVYGDLGGGGTPVLSGLNPADITVTYVGADNIEISATHDVSGMLGPVLRSLTGGSDIGMAFTLEATVTMKAL
jgi:N-methylhydantoinase B/oxoprolinase/acetone carboxylase alpha subunit